MKPDFKFIQLRQIKTAESIKYKEHRFEGSKSSSAFLSNNMSFKMKMNMEHWWTDESHKKIFQNWVRTSQ